MARASAGSTRVEIKGLEPLVHDLDAFRVRAEAELIPRLGKEGVQLVPRAQHFVRSRTGELASSMASRQLTKTVRVGSGKPYAAAQAFGGDVGRNHATHLHPSQVSGWFWKLYTVGKRDVPPPIARWIESECWKANRA